MPYSSIFTNITLPQNNLHPELTYYIHSQYEQDWSAAPHQHPFTEIFFIQNGKGAFVVNDKEYPVKRNSLFIVNPYIEHCEISSKKDPLDFIVLGVNNIQLLQPNKYESHYEMETVSDNFHCFDNINSQEINHLLKQLEQELSNPNELSGFAVNTFLSLILVIINKMKNLSCVDIQSAHLSQHVSTIKNYIDDFFCESITLDTLAQKVFVNKHYLVHSFTKEMGMSPIQYLIHVRLNFAKIFLEKSNYPIKQISQISGFNSYSYFTSVFCKKVGMTPKDYRKQFHSNKSS
ncbi:MAG: AraC family transcriptional regulator [Candidatus Scatosoma sp.]